MFIHVAGVSLHQYNNIARGYFKTSYILYYSTLKQWVWTKRLKEDYYNHGNEAFNYLQQTDTMVTGWVMNYNNL